MMSRPMLLVFLLLILVITSQLEWRQQLVNDVDSGLGATQKQLQITKREEAIKEKVILIQEKKIHRLNQLIESLQQRLSHCKRNNETNGTVSTLTEHKIELDRRHLED